MRSPTAKSHVHSFAYVITPYAMNTACTSATVVSCYSDVAWRYLKCAAAGSFRPTQLANLCAYGLESLHAPPLPALPGAANVSHYSLPRAGPRHPCCCLTAPHNQH